MKEIINVQTNEQNEQRVSARELYKALEVKTSYRFSDWFKKNSKSFKENVDFTSVVSATVVNNGATRKLEDYSMTLDMAKHVAMMSGTQKGSEIRTYFIEVEKSFNSPELMMARSLQYADKKILEYETEITELRPKAMFADAVTGSNDLISIGTLAKLMKKNGIDIGRQRLFEWLRENEYLIKQHGRDWNAPTQKSMDLEVFVATKQFAPDGHINTTTLVTGKGQQYFINKFLGVRGQMKLDIKEV